jgi:hypothetical protein
LQAIQSLFNKILSFGDVMAMVDGHGLQDPFGDFSPMFCCFNADNNLTGIASS